MLKSISKKYSLIINNIIVAESNGIFNIDDFKVGDIQKRYFNLATEDELVTNTIYELNSTSGINSEVIVISTQHESTITDLPRIREVIFKIVSIK